jgi:hypothetical protein
MPVYMADQLDMSFSRTRKATAKQHTATEGDHGAFHIFISTLSRCAELKDAIERSQALLFNWLFMTSGAFSPIDASRPPRRGRSHAHSRALFEDSLAFLFLF